MQFLGIWEPSPFACDGSHQHCTDSDHHGYMRILNEGELAKMIDMADTDQYDGGPSQIYCLEDSRLSKVIVTEKVPMTEEARENSPYYAVSMLRSENTGTIVGAVDWTDH